jgi:hypothetical protein
MHEKVSSPPITMPENSQSKGDRRGFSGCGISISSKSCNADQPRFSNFLKSDFIFFYRSLYEK